MAVSAGPSVLCELRKTLLLKSLPRIAVRCLTQDQSLSNFNPQIDNGTLVNRGDFVGVPSHSHQSTKAAPEAVLYQLQESLRKNFRIVPNNLLMGVVCPLENNEASMRSAIVQMEERWVPMLLTSCGKPMSSIDCKSRAIILHRLFKQLDEKGLISNIKSFNAYLQASLENETADSSSVLSDLATRKLEPDLTTFHLLIEAASLSGNVRQCEDLMYKMGQHGYIPDETCTVHLVFCFGVRGFYQKADSLVEQIIMKYGPSAEQKANGANMRAAARRADTVRLSKLLERCTSNDSKRNQLNVAYTEVFEVIWTLAQQSSREGEYAYLIEQLLERMNRSQGFFRYLVREIERHIAHQYYYTAISLLEDTNRIGDCLNNQHRYKFYFERVSQMCRQLVRHETNIDKVKRCADRMSNVFSGIVRRVHDDLLFAALTYKDFTMDQKIEYLAAFADTVDPERRRPHIILPLLAGASTVDERLKILFRCSNIGYNDISHMDISMLSTFVLQPLYDEQGYKRSQSRLDRVGRILKSFNIEPKVVWNVIHSWWKWRSMFEMNHDERSKSISAEMQGWLRTNYLKIYEGEKNILPRTSIEPTYEKLKSFADSGDSRKVHSFLQSFGFPAGTNFGEISPLLLDMYLTHECWPNVRNFITQLSKCAHGPDDCGEKWSPLCNYHLLQILTRAVREKNEISVRGVEELAFELCRLFPNAKFSYSNFLETQQEYKKLFGHCYDRFKSMTSDDVNDLIDLLRTLVKLNVLALHQTETLTQEFVRQVMHRLGFDEAVNTWMKFQSSLYCSNGILPLLKWCLTTDAKVDMQYVLHKAQNFISPSKVRALYAAMLLVTYRFEEAEEYMRLHKDAISPMDCVAALKLMHITYFKFLFLDFSKTFPLLCLQYTKLKSDAKAIDEMQTELLRICAVKNLAPLALELHELFHEHGAEFSMEAKSRLWSMVEKHNELSRKWIFKPYGFLNILPEDNIVQDNKLYHVQERLRREVEASK